MKTTLLTDFGKSTVNWRSRAKFASVSWSLFLKGENELFDELSTNLLSESPLPAEAQRSFVPASLLFYLPWNFLTLLTIKCSF